MRKTYLDPTITLQKIIGDQIYESLQGPVVEFLRCEYDDGDADDTTKEQQECNNMMIEENTFPDLYRICMQAKQTIGFEQNIDFYLTADSSINASSIAANKPDKQPHVIELNSGLVHLMSEQELLFVIGHEIGHLINGDALLRKLRGFIYGSDEIPDFLQFRFGLYDLLAELSADRYGYIACGGDEKTSIYVMYKLASGIDIGKMNVNFSALIKENKKHLNYFMKNPGRNIGTTHPVHPVRIHSLHLYATCRTEEHLDKEMAKIEDRFCQLDETDATYTRFYIAAGLLMGNMDSPISDNQKYCILDHVGRHCWFPSDFVEQISKNYDLEESYHSTVQLLINDEDGKLQMLDYLLSVAFADDVFSENELHFIYRFGHEVGWEDAQIAQYVSRLLSRNFVHNVYVSHA